ncbi:unnamed protein product [Vitrella brassicaformis CCMP3155]|uniref:Uncharacterized protein n=1 Tax=Vitrella brassicaformis (strain CCMP3155) TaxID=1169540 RepID=A0A0G4EQX0_VITBC|nr:unnamed protein product [Vitrella brassicaformis CCMP3155]|mmetsp:Transcript_41773/g.104241  ORF Transcript_41773/g.104241 Transcript_41773/m.104241 type:complete len:124 (-) Transcript_41773:517-888(-)|eukprot:CEL99878.1 unnamed protein product [Vitrella brassicaformis CCMP3155]
MKLVVVIVALLIGLSSSWRVQPRMLNAFGLPAKKPIGEVGKYASPYQQANPVNAYVPKGMTLEQFNAIQQQDVQKIQDSKDYWKTKYGTSEPLAEWLIKREKKYPGQPKAGHRYVKSTYVPPS